VQAFCLEGHPGPAKTRFASVPVWQRLRQLGTELWLDTGDAGAAAALWCDEFTALTTNNTLLNKEVQKGIHDALVPRAARLIRDRVPDIAERDLVLEVAFVLNAVHGLGLVARFGAKVSVELHTDLAHDAAASVAYGQRYHAVCPTHFIVKVPLTPSGLIAARRLADAGIPVNFTLGFSARQNLLIARAARPDYCNVFMGRINALLADRKLSDGNNAGERATASSQRVVAEVRAAGLCKTRQIGASMRGPAQVPALAGLDVYTMPLPVAQGFLDGKPDPKTLRKGVGDEFKVTFAPGIDAHRDGLHVFWDVDDGARAAIEALAHENVAALAADDVTRILASRGGATFFPRFEPAETARIAKDGKIPALDPWRDGVRGGRLAWDTMLTESGLQSFAQDQAALDQRIRGLLAKQ
jgi:transaldolase